MTLEQDLEQLRLCWNNIEIYLERIKDLETSIILELKELKK
jgi:hypothetical protein